MSIQTMATIPTDEEGSYPALAGVVPAPVGKRVGALVLEAAIVLIVYQGLDAVILAIGVAQGNYTLLQQGPQVLGWLQFFTAVGVQVWCMVKRGHWLGGVLLKITHVDVETGQPAPGKVLKKFLLQYAINLVTLGIGFLIIALVSMRSTTGRNWLDRMTGLMVIDIKNGPMPSATAAAGAARVTYPMTVIAPVGVPSPPPLPQSANPFASATPPPFQTPTNRFAQTSTLAAAPFTQSPPPSPAAAPLPPPSVAAPLPPLPASSPALQNPFSPRTAAPIQPIVPVDRPGADAFIEATPFSSAAPQAAPPLPAPLLGAPAVVNERDIVPQVDVGETVLDAAVFTPATGGLRELVVDGDLILPNGQITLLGRNPTGSPTLESAVPIALADTDLKISKTHLAVGLEDGAWWVMDLHSTNGTTIVHTSGNHTRCEPGVSTPVAPGDVVRFGTHEIKARP